MAKAAKKVVAPNVELNRWCIEMAMRWPVVHVQASYGNGLQGANAIYQQPVPARDIDADVIGRAEKIMAWVKAAH
jgi:hypothetical protein